MRNRQSDGQTIEQSTVKRITEIDALRVENLMLRYEIVRVQHLAPLDAEKAKLLDAIEKKYDAQGYLLDVPHRQLVKSPNSQPVGQPDEETE